MTLAENMVGIAVSPEWVITEKIVPPEGHTGGNFSIGYRAQNPSGRSAFVKVLDLSKAIFKPDPTTELQAMTTAFNFERGLLRECRRARMSRVVLAVEEGTYSGEGPDGRPESVPYIVFEMAEKDLRTSVLLDEEFNLAFKMRVLHNVATGLMQLHSRSIAHQDLKPSNVLSFGEAGSKIADLGRASLRGVAAPHDDLPGAGDLRNLPPETLYGFVAEDWAARRNACDLYHLGSLAVFLFASVGLTHVLRELIPQELSWSNWDGEYEQVVPVVRRALSTGLGRISGRIPVVVRDNLILHVRYLCDPDPFSRGHPRARAAGNPYSLERFVSAFDLLAARAESAIRRRAW